MGKEKKEKKPNKLFKNILKYTGWFFLVIILAFGIGVFTTWIKGGFDPEKIYIQELSIGGQKEYVTITQNDESYTTTVDFAPAEANQLTLTANILTGKDLIAPLDKVEAGQPIKLNFLKDENGITKGGEVEIKFIDSSKKAFTTLKVLIDVGLNEQYIDVKSNGVLLTGEEGTPNTLNTKVLTTVSEESANKIKISADYDEMLNSYKGNWSESANNSLVTLNKLKKMILRYKDDIRVRDFKVSEVIGESNYYLIEYLTPATTDEPFSLDVYLYKTYFLEGVFSEEFANSLFDAIEKTDFNSSSVDYQTLNSFINTYVYDSSNVDIKNNFDTFRDKTSGLIELNPIKYITNAEEFVQAIDDTINFVFAKKTILISVDRVQIKGISNLKNEQTSEDKNVTFPVLTDVTYTVDDINEKLGISLVGEDDAVDKQILHNLIRDLNIEICVEDINYEDPNSTPIEEEGDDDKYYIAGDKCFEKLDTESATNKLRIIKNEADDGTVTWSMEALSPTQSNSKYYIVYSYKNNKFGTLNKDTNIIEGSALQYQGTTPSKYYYNEENGKWYINYNVNTKQFKNEVTDVYLLNQLYNRKYSYSPLQITYTPGTISFNSNVSNRSKTIIALNTENSIYTNDSSQKAQVVTHGSSAGIYYNSIGRDFTVGEKTTEEQIMDTNVIVRANDLSKTMEYTCVRWFVPYNANIVQDSAGVLAEPLRYYFKPVVKKNFEENLNTNEIPAMYKLRNIDGGSLLRNSNSTTPEGFMEIGRSLVDGDGNIMGVNIQALNAMEDESKPISLYAVIVQTDKNGEAIEEERGIDDITGNTTITYTYVAAAGGTEQDHTLVSMQRIEKLYTYINDGGFKNVVLQTGNIINYNWLQMEIGSTEDYFLYVSSFNLNASGEPILTNADWWENSVKIMSSAVDEKRNQTIALKRFFDEILNGGLVNCTWSQYGSATPAAPPEFTASLPTASPYIAFKITYTSMIDEAKEYTLSIKSIPNNTSENAFFFTNVITTGYVKVAPASS